MKHTNSRAGNVRTMHSHLQPTARESDGILVQEEELSLASAQHLYRIRCDCGRSWFELELKALVKCPACHRLNRVQIT